MDRTLYLWGCFLKLSSIQPLSRVQLFVTPRTAADQASLSITISWSLLKLMSIESVMQSNSLILHRPFSSCLSPLQHQVVSFLMSQFFTSGGQSIGTSASASVLPVNIQDRFPLGLIGLISLKSKGLSRVFSNTIVQKHQFKLLYPDVKTMDDYNNSTQEGHQSSDPWGCLLGKSPQPTEWPAEAVATMGWRGWDGRNFITGYNNEDCCLYSLTCYSNCLISTLLHTKPHFSFLEINGIAVFPILFLLPATNYVPIYGDRIMVK